MLLCEPYLSDLKPHYKKLERLRHRHTTQFLCVESFGTSYAPNGSHGQGLFEQHFLVHVGAQVNYVTAHCVSKSTRQARIAV